MTDSAMQWAVERERELRKWSYLEYRVRDIGLQEAGIPRFEYENPVRELGQQIEEDLMREAYPLSDPHHPDFHSVHADLWDMREGK